MNHSNLWLVGDHAVDGLRERLGLALKAREKRGADMGTYADCPEPRCAARIVDGVAVIGVQASFLYHGRDEWLDVFGGLSYQCLAEECDRAAANPAILAVVFQVNCGGGSVSGAVEFVDAVKKLAATKRTFAVAHDMACSGAYWPFAVCDEIIASPTAIVGSVGGVSAIDDTTGLFTQMGVKRTKITSPEGGSALKGAGMMGTEVTAEQIAAQQAALDEPVAMFVGDVAAGRGVSVETVKGWQAGAFAAQDSVRRGIADRVEHFKDALARIVAAYGGSGTVNVPPPAAASNDPGTVRKGGTEASIGNGTPGAKEIGMDLKTLTRAQLAEANPGLVDLIKNEGKAEGAKPPAASIKELRDAFPSDATYALDCAEKGLSLVQAKADFGMRLMATVEKLETKVKATEESLAAANAKLTETEGKLKAANTRLRGSDPVETDLSGNGEPEGGAPKTFAQKLDAKAAELVVKDKCTETQARARAMDILRREDPAGMRAYAMGVGAETAKK